jgi:putative aldouronate transport system permease protein
MKIRSRADRIFDICNVLFLSLILITILYPLYLIVIASFSDPNYVNTGEVWLIPEGFNFNGYKHIFQDDNIWIGYKNTLIYTAVGTLISVSLTLTGGYALSRKDLVGRNFFMALIVFTMFFEGGMIPTYLLVKSLGMINTMWALVIPGAVGVYHLIVTRTFFLSTIPDELLEAAVMDGCSNTRFFVRIVLPLSLPIVAVMVLFYAVMQWNSFFPALIYLRDEALYPLQLILRDILIANEVQDQMVADLEELAEQQNLANLIKYGIIIVSSLPVLILYPFLQRYFVKGVMIGSIKG